MEEARARAALALLALFLGSAAGAQPARQMVAAAHPLAAEAGLAILKQGGSALDAAITAQMVLNVVEPQSSGIGGGAFLLYWSEKERKLRSYDGRETAPASARGDRFLDSNKKPIGFRDAVTNGLSVGVPGLLRVLELAHARHGRMRWSELFQHAIFAAEEGFAMPPRLHAALRELPGAVPEPVGALVRNRELAATLRVVAQRGADIFYTGAIADDIVAAVAAHKGDLSKKDLQDYRAREREALCGPYRAWRVCSMGPPSSGGVTLLELLGLLERTTFKKATPQSIDALHLYLEAARLAYADRDRYVGDPDFVRVPLAGLLDPAYLDARARLIGPRSMGVAPPGEPAGAPRVADVPQLESAGTSHLSVVDADGDAVALTTTIEASFGSRIRVRGFYLNNELTDFAFIPEAQGRPAANRVEGNKRPRSSMAPTIVFAADGRVEKVLGSPGGQMIINYVGKALVGMLDWKLDAQAAAALPNFGSLNGPTLLENKGFDENLILALKNKGHEIRTPPLASGLHIIERTPQGWRGAADPRRDGIAAGD